MKYDYLIVGAGLFGAVFAHEMQAKGKHCLVIDKRSHLAGNIYTQEINGIQVHKYGAHIFIRQTGRCGITSGSLPGLIITSIRLLRYIKMNCTIFPLI